MARYHLLGGAVKTTTTGSVSSSGAVVVAIADASGWPDASVGPYPIVIDPDTPLEEKLLVTARAGLNLTVTSGNRGHDGTSAQGHSTGAVVYPVVTAAMLDKFDAHVEDATLHLGTGQIDDSAYFTAGVVNAAAIGTNAVTANKIDTGAVVEAKLGAGSVVASKLGTGAVTADKIGTDAVTTEKIQDAAINAAKIDDGSVGTAELADGAVTTAKIADANVTAGKLAAGISPTGAVSMWLTSSAPSGWLLCDGTAVSRATYAALFAVVGTTYGVGDGSTTFNVPNLKGKVPVGLDAAQTEFDTLAETGGANTVTLTAAQSGMPAHSTGGMSATHEHPIDIATGSGAQVGVVVAASTPAENLFGDYIGPADTDHSHAVAAVSASSAHANLQPYLVVNFIVRT